MVAPHHKNNTLILMCRSRMVIECAFGRLKARIAALKRPMDIVGVTDTVDLCDPSLHHLQLHVYKQQC